MRARRLAEYMASLPDEPLGEPVLPLSRDERRAWDDIVSACPDVLRAPDVIFVDMLARNLALWRAGALIDPAWLRLMYRNLGRVFMPMSERRRLLFPDRARVLH